MAREPSDLVQYKLRIREEVRGRLEQAAKKRGVSVNYEITSRIEDSFGRESLRTIDVVASGLELRWARFENAFHALDKQGDLLRGTEALLAQIEELPSEIQEALASAVTRVRRTIQMFDAEAVLAARRMRTTGEV
jgi:Arc-like DNA binding domain